LESTFVYGGECKLSLNLRGAAPGVSGNDQKMLLVAEAVEIEPVSGQSVYSAEW
jgi:hypothetical protein